MRPRLCDVCLLTEDGHHVYAHRAVLATTLQYFSSMFVSGGAVAATVDDSNKPHSKGGSNFVEQKHFKIELKNITGASLEEIVHYCYTGSVHINETTVQALYTAGAMIGCSDIVATCGEFVKSRLHVLNALGVFTFAELMASPDLSNYVLLFICDNFLQVAATTNEEFCQLSVEHLEKIIASDFVDTRDEGEEAVLQAVLNWVALSPDQRLQHLSQLVHHVRFPVLKLESLINIEHNFPMVKQEASAKDLLIEALKYRLYKVTTTPSAEQHITINFPPTSAFSELNLPTFESGGGVVTIDNSRCGPRSFLSATQMFDLTGARFRERTPRSRQACLLVVGGQAPKAIRESEYLNFGTGEWCSFPFELPARRCRCAMVVLDEHIYAIGGFNGQSRVKTMVIFNPKENEWQQGASLQARRSTLGACVINKRIYAVGGFDGHIGLQSSEVYDPVAKKWSLIAEMSTRRSSVAVAALNGRIYAVGGYDGSARQCLASVECYDPATNTWSQVAEMSQRRSGAAVAVLGGKLYAIGGHDGPSIRKSVECYDPATNRWHQCSDMITSRRNAGVVAKDCKLYVIGGDDGQSNLKSIEIYGPASNSWTKFPVEMSIGRSYSGVAIINKSWS